MNDEFSNHLPEMTSISNATETAPFGQTAPALVVYGLDDAGKPHASLFDAPEAGLAEKAAELMNMRAVHLTAPEQLAAVVGLPKGRIFGSGKAFVPFVKRAVYERLTTMGGKPAPRSGSQSTSSVRHAATAVNGARRRSELARDITNGGEPDPLAQVPPAESPEKAIR